MTGKSTMEQSGLKQDLRLAKRMDGDRQQQMNTPSFERKKMCSKNIANNVGVKVFGNIFNLINFNFMLLI